MIVFMVNCYELPSRGGLEVERWSDKTKAFVKELLGSEMIFQGGAKL